MLQGKHILIGVCGSIAAYKSAILIRELIKEGAEVRVIMTASSRSFITPLTLSTLSKNPVLSSFEKNETGEWNNHVELADWADVLVIAPASAHTISKMANGICDNLLIATYLSAKCPVIAAPAMDLEMYAHPSTLKNLKTLTAYGNSIIDADYGELASGLIGQGRMAEPQTIVDNIRSIVKKKSPLTKTVFTGQQVLITAGPTQEAIDPVRYIGNHSTGKMGFALAHAFAEAGATVTLVSGPTDLQINHVNIRRIDVRSADEMFEAAQESFKGADITVLAAAVADYKPIEISEQKIKKGENDLALPLTRTIDIAATFGEEKKNGQVLIGFALETENEFENAAKKLVKKNFDLIVLNSLNDKGAGFGHDTNKITILDRKNHKTSFSLKNKSEVAGDILEAITKFMA